MFAVPGFATAYLDAVREYRSGRLGPAFSAMLGLYDEIELTIAWRQRLVSTFGWPKLDDQANWSVADVKASALIHIELAVARLTPEDQKALHDRHFEAAERVLELWWGKHERVLPVEFRRGCYVAMLWERQFIGDLGGLANLLNRVELEFAGDPHVILAAGTLSEEIAWLMRQRPYREPAYQLPRRLRGLVGRPRRAVLADAEAYYRRALAVEPGLGEAALRLGRVLAERGRHEDALDSLAPLLRSADDPWLAYLARLFSGGACEELGRFEDAVAHYTIAAALEPRARTARLALSRALDEVDQRTAASAAAGAALDIPLDQSYDPWLEYHHGQSRMLDGLLWRLRQEVIQ